MYPTPYKVHLPVIYSKITRDINLVSLINALKDVVIYNAIHDEIYNKYITFNLNFIFKQI